MYYIYTEESTEYDGEKNISVICHINDCHLNNGIIIDRVIREISRFKVTNLICKDCKIQQIPYIHTVNYIECINCPELCRISSSKNLIELYCINCPKLSIVPDLESIFYLTLDKCGVKDISNLHSLEELYIKDTVMFDNCINLTKIDCTECKNVSIPNLPQLKTLVCYNATFSSIGNLPKLRQVSGERLSYIKNFNKKKSILLLMLNFSKREKTCTGLIQDMNLWKKIFEFI